MAFKVTIIVHQTGVPTMFGGGDETTIEMTRRTRDEAFAAAIATLFQMGGVTLSAYMKKMMKLWEGLLPFLRAFREDAVVQEDIDKTVEVNTL